MTDLGKMLVLCGGILLAAGLFLIAGGRLHLPLGRLPGDIVHRGKQTTFYFPLATSILVSIILSVVFYLIGRAGR